MCPFTDTGRSLFPETEEYWVKIETIKNGSLRVWLSHEDMARFGVSVDTMDGDDVHTARLLSQLLAVVSRQFGRRCAGILAEAIPVAGGCVLLLTPRRKAVGGALVYRPRDLEALYALAEHWNAISETPCTSLYELGEEYRLIVSPCGALPVELRRLLNVYGDRVGTGAAAAAAVGEHGRLLCAGNALEMLLNAPPRDPHLLS